MAGIVLILALAATLAERSSSIRTDRASRRFLKQLIATDLPQLATAGPGSSTSLTRLRQWAFENTDWSTPSANLDDDRRNRFLRDGCAGAVQCLQE